MARLIATVLLALPPLSLCAQTPVPADGASTITEADMLRRIGVMAADSMRGRDTPSPELNETAAWIASEFEAMGLRGGAADGSFLQRYPLAYTAVQVEDSYVEGGSTRLEFGPDVLPAVGDVMNGERTAGLAVVSGSGDIERGLADGVVRDQHVLVIPSPTGNFQQQFYSLVAPLMRAGAASILVVTPASDAEWDAGASGALRSAVYRTWVGGGPRAAANFLPVLQLKRSSAEALMTGSGLDVAALQARSGDVLRVDRLSGPDVTVALRYAEEEVTAPNVLGVLEGSDPELRGEYVVVSAHMDHVGTGGATGGFRRSGDGEEVDSIYNGADDNASGTSGVMEIAEAMASLPTPPRRSMMFVLVSGEEHGLWGSEYLAANSPVPLDDLVADLNMDMIGRNWPDTIVAIGKEHSDLGETLERVNRAHPELGMTAIDDLWPQESFYTRSDHYNFARQGVPILFFFNGVHDDYHGPDDELDRIDGEKAARIAKLVFYLAVELADRDERPRWDPRSYRDIVGSSR